MKKIMFSDKFGLTEAVLSGRKTQTRRIIKPQPEVSERMGMVWKGYAYGITSPAGSPFFLKDVYENFLSGTDYPQDHRYKVGEVVAVAQSYKSLFEEDCRRAKEGKPMRNVTIKNVSDHPGWTNKMFVRADQMFHHIRITNVRVERLQDISDEDCIAGGVCKWTKDRELFKYDIADGFEMFEWSDMPSTPREAYAALIDKISGKGTWEANPYVFVYEFELIK